MKSFFTQLLTFCIFDYPKYHTYLPMCLTLYSIYITFNYIGIENDTISVYLLNISHLNHIAFQYYFFSGGKYYFLFSFNFLFRPIFLVYIYSILLSISYNKYIKTRTCGMGIEPNIIF